MSDAIPQDDTRTDVETLLAEIDPDAARIVTALRARMAQPQLTYYTALGANSLLDGAAAAKIERQADTIAALRRERDEAREKSFRLWKLLDDIDTLDDSAKQNDTYFRTRAYEIQRRRFGVIGEPAVDELYAEFDSPERAALNARDVLAASSDMSASGAIPEGWRDIATAPKDGSWFLGWRSSPYPECRVDVWHWDMRVKTDGADGFWLNAADSNIDEYPTHWQPLPEPPIQPPADEPDTVGSGQSDLSTPEGRE